MACHHPQLLADIVAFIAKADRMSEVTFGRKALRDPHFVRDLKNGRQIFATTEARVREFMAQYEAQLLLASTGKARAISGEGLRA